MLLKIAFANFPVVLRKRETLIPIPNMTVKPFAAEGTWVATPRENRWLPDFRKKQEVRNQKSKVRKKHITSSK